MKKSVSFLLVFLLFTASQALAAGVKNITSKEASGILSRDKSVLLLDVRTPDEYQKGHLRNSVLIPITEMERRYAEIPKSQPVIVYCTVGARSSAVAGFLWDRGYRQVYNMTDGLMGWYRNRLPIVH